jgi:hypothetical protein
MVFVAFVRHHFAVPLVPVLNHRVVEMVVASADPPGTQGVVMVVLVVRSTHVLGCGLAKILVHGRIRWD